MSIHILLENREKNLLQLLFHSPFLSTSHYHDLGLAFPSLMFPLIHSKPWAASSLPTPAPSQPTALHWRGEMKAEKVKIRCWQGNSFILGAWSTYLLFQCSSVAQPVGPCATLSSWDMTHFYTQVLYLGSDVLPQFSSPEDFTSVMPIGLFPLVHP